MVDIMNTVQNVCVCVRAHHMCIHLSIYLYISLHCTLISFTILIPASQPVWPAGRFRVIWPAGRFGVIWPAGRFGVIWPAGRFRRIWPAGRFRKIWPAAGFCSKRSASVHTLHMSKTCNGLLRYILYTCPNLM